MRPFGIRVRLLLALTVLLVTIFAIVTSLLVSHDTNVLRKSLEDQTTSFGALATNPIGDAYVLYKDGGQIALEQRIRKYTDLDANIVGVAVIDTSNKVLYKTPSKLKLSSLPNQAGQSFEPKKIKNAGGDLTELVYPYIEDYGLHRYSLVYIVSSDSINKSINSLVYSLMLTSAAILAISLFLAYMLINFLLLRPVAGISEAAHEISLGDLNRQIEVRRKDELGDLADAVNKMAFYLKDDIRKLQELDKMKSEFLSITSHHLRTPLTTIEGYLSLIQEDQMNDGMKKSINSMKGSVSRLHLLTDSMLSIATLEAGEQIAKLETKPLQPAMAEIITKFKPMAAQKQLQVIDDTSANPVVAIQPASFRTAVLNILDNAVKFTPENGKVSVVTTESDGKVFITIKDSGIGIKPEEVNKLFTKFHRGTDYMQFDYDGVGIGLYLTKLIINQHGGHITVQSQPEQGSTFTIILPVAKQGQN